MILSLLNGSVLTRMGIKSELLSILILYERTFLKQQECSRLAQYRFCLLRLSQIANTKSLA